MGQTLALQNTRSAAASALVALQNPPKDKNGNISQRDRDAYYQRAGGLQAQVSALDSQLAASAVSMQQLVQNGAAMEQQMEQLVTEGQRVGADFVVQEQLFGKTQKSLEGQAKRDAKSSAERTPKLSDQQLAFPTYDDFGYETEKQRILDSLSIK